MFILMVPWAKFVLFIIVYLMELFFLGSFDTRLGVGHVDATAKSKFFIFFSWVYGRNMGPCFPMGVIP